MANQMINTHGAFSWFELSTTDVEGAKKFYSKLLGWNYSFMGPDESYSIIELNEVGIGGIFQKPETDPAPMWGNVIYVDNVDASAEKAQALGGSIVVPPTDIPSVGRFSMIQDPQGAVFSIVTYLEQS